MALLTLQTDRCNLCKKLTPVPVGIQVIYLERMHSHWEYSFSWMKNIGLDSVSRDFSRARWGNITSFLTSFAWWIVRFGCVFFLSKLLSAVMIFMKETVEDKNVKKECYITKQKKRNFFNSFKSWKQFWINCSYILQQAPTFSHLFSLLTIKIFSFNCKKTYVQWKCISCRSSNETYQKVKDVSRQNVKWTSTNSTLQGLNWTVDIPSKPDSVLRHTSILEV